MKMKKLIKQWTVPVLCGLFIFIMFRFVFFIGYIPSESMEPEIKTGSYIIGYRFVGEISHGDVIVFNQDGFMLVKRVAAVPGDVIYINDSGGVISFNEEIPHSARIFTVPDECYFVLGDNTGNSDDSRLWKDPFIKKTQIIAKVYQ